MVVKKFGHTTGFTVGAVEALTTAPLGLDYNSKHFKAKVWFTNVWFTAGQDAQQAAAAGSDYSRRS